MFKTPHHSTFVRDQYLKVVDVALATSAAPTFFQMHQIGGERFVDGGLYSNSPDLMALHEAEHFLAAESSSVSILSIGTTSANFSMSSTTPINMGWVGWMSGQRLISTMIASQQLATDYMLRHKLGARYVRIDRSQSKEQERQLTLDTASQAAISDLGGLAEASFRDEVVKEQLRNFFKFPAPTFSKGS